MAKKGLVFITKSTFSGASAVNIDNCFSATYTHYLVKRNLLGSSAGLDLNGRLRVSATDASGTDYRDQLLTVDNTIAGGARTTGATSWARLLGVTEATTFGYSEAWISNPFEAVRTTAWNDAGRTMTGSLILDARVYAHDLTTSYTGFSVIPSSGTITGSISVFGLVKS